MQRAKVGVLLVVTNEEKYLNLFIKAFLSQSYPNCYLYVLDNNCSDNSMAILKDGIPKFDVITMPETTGFAKGNNLLAQKAIGDGCDYLFILNPDIELDLECIKELVNLIESDNKVGAVAPIMFFGLHERNLNKIQSYADHINFNKRRVESIYGGQLFNEINAPEIIDVNVVSGGITFIRSSIVKEIGLFDERYFIYGEESDLAMRFYQKKIGMSVTSKAKVWHHHDWSPKNKKKHYFSYFYMNRSQVIYFKKFKLYNALIVFLLVEFGQFLLKLRWALKIADYRLFYFYYLGIISGLQGNKGKSTINFDKYD